MSDERRRQLRLTFDDVPELYDHARPLYPAEILDDLVSLAGIPEHGRVLEIGCGTGQATIPLAERGFGVVCVELGARLADFARRKLAQYANVEVVHGSFETFEPRAPFDAVVAFTAFHWIDPDTRYEKAASVLRRGGALAVVNAEHVLLEDGDPFWIEVQDDYDAVVPSDENRPPPHPDEVRDLRDEIAASGRFGAVAVRRYVWDLTYTADEYVDLLDTYSGHRSIEADARRRLYDRIHARIAARPGGTVTKTYLGTLNVARKA